MHTPTNRRVFVILAALAFLSLLNSAPAEPYPLNQFIPAPPVGIQSGAGFGASVAAEGSFVVVGAPFDNLRGDNSGVVKVFDAATGALLHVLLNPNPEPDSEFGNAVAISGTRVVVGAYRVDLMGYIEDSGVAYVFDLASATPTEPIATFENPDPEEDDQFAYAVAISGTRVVIGAPRDRTGAISAGKAYVYDVSSATPSVPVRILTNPEAGGNEQFGRAVAIVDNRALIGAPYSTSGGHASAGTAYLFDLASGTPTVPISTFENPAPAAGDAFGEAVAFSGTRIVIGARLDDTSGSDAGSAYVYDLTSGIPTQPIATLNNPGAGGEFGTAVAISGARVLVGSHLGVGRAYVYDIAGSSPTVPAATLNNPEPAANDNFGKAVAIFGTRAVVGAYLDDMGATDAGSVYMYELASGTPTTPAATLNNPGPASDENFGYSVGVSGTRLVVGVLRDHDGPVNGGRAYVYDLASATPGVPIVTLNNPTPAADDFFGASVAISGARVVVGAYKDDAGATDAGSVYVYDLGAAVPSLPALTINNPSPASGDGFGICVSISGSRIVVGADKNMVANLSAGTAYVYDLASGTPTDPVVTLENPSPAAEEYFGASVAISGTRVIVGASGDGTGGPSAGSAYIYNLTSGTPTVPEITLNNPTLSSGHEFGSATAISGTRAVVGTGSNSRKAYAYDLEGSTPTQPIAEFDGHWTFRVPLYGQTVAISGTRVLVANDYDTGSVSVYDLASATPMEPIQVIDNPEPWLDDRFGHSVAIDGTTLVIGVFSDDFPLGNSGSVFVYGSNDTVTAPPTLDSPQPNTASSTSVNVSFMLPEGALPGSVTLTFAGDITRSFLLAATQEVSGPRSFSFDPKLPLNCPEFASGNAIPDGTYTVTLSYQDAVGNPAAVAVAVNVSIDSLAPTIGGTFSPLALAEGALPNYVPQVQTSDASGMVTVNQLPLPGTPVTPGMTAVTLTARDAAGNESSIAFNVVVRPASPLSTLVVTQGGEAPGAGQLNGPPTGSILSTLGAPAIDGDGHLAFTATWSSAVGLGRGIFRENACVVKIGDSAPGLTGATFKTFTDPVIDDGHVAFLATLAGVPKQGSAVVVTEMAPGQLEVIARAGGNAPGTGSGPGAGEALFKGFESVSVSGNAVGFLAQLTSGTGTPRTTAANDFGLWVKTGASPLVLALREGQEIAPGKVIKKLVSFVGGNGSPGQGRGWLIGTADGAQALAHVTLTDKSQAIVAVALDDAMHPVVLSHSGSDSGFSSYGLPTANAANHSAFLASLIVDGEGITKLNSRGIFADLNGSGAYSAIVRAGDSTAEPDSSFSLLKDPVLAADGGLAFSATLKGEAIKGLNAQTLWWQPSGGELILVAQGGVGAIPVAGIPEAQWKSFPSLAIAANRGPIFTGTLVPGKGGVTKATSNGLWATDFEGNLRLLVQSGVTQIDGKTVKSFTLLNANVGSQGTTRSFNDNGFIVWRSTFDDNTQAIIKTEVP